MDDEDDTMILRMKKDFISFMPTSGTATGSSVKTSQQLVKQLDFNISNLSGDADEGSLRCDNTLLDRKKYRLQHADLLTTRGRLSHVEAQLSCSELSRKRGRIECEGELQELRTEQLKEQQQHRKWRHEYERLEMRYTEVERALKDTRAALDSRNAPAQKQLHQVMAEREEVRREYETTEHALKTQLSQLTKSRITDHAELSANQLQLDEMSQRLEIMTGKCTKLETEINELESWRLEALRSAEKVKDFESRISLHEADSVLVSAMKSDLLALKDVRHENSLLSDEVASLRGNAENSLLLIEQLHSLKSKLTRSEGRMEDYHQLQGRCQEMESKFKSGSSDGDASFVPHDLKIQLGELRLANALFLEKQGELQSRTRASENSLLVAEKKLRAEEEKAIGQRDLVKRLQRKLLFITKERNGYENILKSYEGEVTVAVVTATRLEQQQSQLEEYRRMCEELERRLEQRQQPAQQATVSSMRTPTSQASGSVDEKMIVSLREQIAKLGKELDKVKGDKEELEERLERCHLQGDYDARRTKVVHLKVNPASEQRHLRATELQRLRSDNERLIQRVRLLAEAPGGSTDTPLADLTVVVEQRLNEGTSSREIEGVRSQLESATLKNQRLMEVFKRTTADFRKMCYKLLGYRVDLLASSCYELHSAYAASDRDSLLFQRSENGDIQLLETAYSATLTAEIETYLAGADSIPAFLSSITLSLLNDDKTN